MTAILLTAITKPKHLPLLAIIAIFSARNLYYNHMLITLQMAEHASMVMPTFVKKQHTKSLVWLHFGLKDGMLSKQDKPVC